MCELTPEERAELRKCFQSSLGIPLDLAHPDADGLLDDLNLTPEGDDKISMEVLEDRLIDDWHESLDFKVDLRKDYLEPDTDQEYEDYELLMRLVDKPNTSGRIQNLVEMFEHVLPDEEGEDEDEDYEPLDLSEKMDLIRDHCANSFANPGDLLNFRLTPTILITVEKLLAMGACGEESWSFCEIFPNGLEITEDQVHFLALRADYLEVGFDWFLEKCKTARPVRVEIGPGYNYLLDGERHRPLEEGPALFNGTSYSYAEKGIHLDALLNFVPHPTRRLVDHFLNNRDFRMFVYDLENLSKETPRIIPGPAE